ncbi:hypothetical protein [[Micrococcus luteus] ATCC 49442]|uniref:hypothetical protein n=1 Tax=[Micrococcus luteus] ATCC 49442 TaxID=2698727 RepID=UPI0013DBCDF3|nr:hypothetical protein [[Micrococcus luteus] ATCC 49442]
MQERVFELLARESLRGEALSRPSTPILSVTSVLFFFCAGAAWVGASGVLDQDYHIFWLAVALSFFLAGLFFLIFSHTRGFGLSSFRLGPWFLGYAVVAYGLASLTLVGPLDISLRVIDKSSFPTAFGVVAIGAAAWSVGYATGPSRAIRRAFLAGRVLVTKGLSGSIRGRGVLLVLFTLAMGADVFGIVVDGRFGYLGEATNVTAATVQWYGQPLSILSNLKYVALFGAAARVYVEKKDSPIPFLIPLASVTLLWGLLEGMKESFVTCLVSIAVPYFIGKGKLKLLPIFMTLVVFVVIVTPAVSALRTDVRGDRGSMDVNSALAAATERIFSTDTYNGSSDNDSVDSIASRVRLVDNVAVIAQRTPSEIPFRSMDELAIAPISALIPRLFWPDKPVQISGYEFFKNYYGGLSKSSSAITLPGSLYLYGGVSVVVIGMCLCGFLLRGFDDVIRARSSLTGALLVSISFTIIVKQEIDVSTFLATIPVLAATWIIGCRALFVPSNNVVTASRGK